jgi:hypothetical protein
MKIWNLLESPVAPYSAEQAANIARHMDRIINPDRKRNLLPTLSIKTKFTVPPKLLQIPKTPDIKSVVR